MIKGTRILGMVLPRGTIRLSHVCIGLLYRYLTLREMCGRKLKQPNMKLGFAKCSVKLKKSKIFKGNQCTRLREYNLSLKTPSSL